MNAQTAAALTPQELALYLGCEAELVYDPTGHGKIELLKTRQGCITADVLAEFSAYYSIKPYLKKDSDLTEEELLQLAEAGGTLKPKTTHENKILTAKNIIKGGFYNPIEFTYLLSIYIDLFGHIEAGRALDKNQPRS